MMLLEIILTLPAAALLLIALFFLLEVMAGGLYLGRRNDAHEMDGGENLGAIAVIIPAHNESAGIIPTIKDVQAQMRAGDRLIVVADNCDDDTGVIARTNGAEVLERSDKARRGKGYALQFAIDALREEPPAALFFVDADCRLEKQAIVKTVSAALAADRPAQALYLMNASTSDAEGRSPKQAVAAFAWLLINKVRMAGLAQVFGFTRLTGAGMAMPWSIAQSLALGSGEIVEDLALTLKLVERQEAPLFVPSAVVTSEFPSADGAAAKQRARWEHGSMRVARNKIPDLIAGGLIKGDGRLIAMGLDLSVPPLTVFAVLLLLSLTGGAVLAIFGLMAPLYAAVFASMVFALGVMIAWVGFGRSVLPVGTVAAVIPYILGKAHVYGADARQSTKTWTRTDRSGSDPS